jgi:hypothetical protein
MQSRCSPALRWRSVAAPTDILAAPRLNSTFKVAVRTTSIAYARVYRFVFTSTCAGEE